MTTLIDAENKTTSNEKFIKQLITTTKIPKILNKNKDSQKFIHESEVDTENLPVIQGSFEITKTEADITQKRNKVHQPLSTISLPTSTLKPLYFSPNYKTNITKINVTKDDILEKYLQHQKNLTTTFYSPTESTTLDQIEDIIENEQEISSSENDRIALKSNEEFPKLDSNLFTTAPLIDNEPWLPINPTSAQTTTETISNTPNSKQIETLMYRNKISNSNNSNDSVHYQSFYNTDFSGSSLEIEKLGGIGDVKPYQLPVNKINFSEESDIQNSQQLMKNEFDLIYDKEKFEHLGGGVIAKKPDFNDTTFNSTVESFPKSHFNNTELAESRINNITTINSYEDHGEKNTSNNIETSTKKLSFMNMKDYIVQKMQSNSNLFLNETTVSPLTSSEPQLFPSITKWEFVNGTRLNNELNVTKKVFNETLFAVIVQNVNPSSFNSKINDEKITQTAKKANLQQISSIFDNLASKLGLNIDVTSKIPPFSQQSQNKLKQNANREKNNSENFATEFSKMTTQSSMSKVTDNFSEIIGQAEVEGIFVINVLTWFLTIKLFLSC